ncbi:RimJ/RimL family protein N-acetyltransferase [Rhizobium sp. BIGb0125]|uniref:GNAT family N-acetyltransferase n=1 Tax=Rhizobium sp. BIGb0125 TaxID=2940618 RepID=UPI0021675EEA|nr:GNAT family protein [Rhizobium sp. BIGb0125]MCS4242431.1 RimJ/RimL family protein N-acetyltransferase [Rhizobium sp. BIGb0125]
MMTLIDFEPAHFPVLRSWLSSERELVQWGGPDLTFPVSDEQLEQMRAEASGTPPKRLCWMAVDADQALAGHIQLAMDWRHGVARIGRVIIAPDHRGKGLAGPLLQAVLERAFSYPEIERVELNVYTWNTPAMRTYAKVGFVPEGVRRSSVQVGDERWDTAIMGLLRAEWEAI